MKTCEMVCGVGVCITLPHPYPNLTYTPTPHTPTTHTPYSHTPIPLHPIHTLHTHPTPHKTHTPISTPSHTQLRHQIHEIKAMIQIVKNYNSLNPDKMIPISIELEKPRKNYGE